MTSHRRSTRRILLGATALAGALALSATQASAQERHYDFDVPAQPLNAALQTFARQAQLQVIFAERETKDLRAPPLNGSYSADEALQVLLAGTELKATRTSKGVLQIAANPAPQSGSAAGGGAEVEALIVTAQKREEDIQDVPIAISAFTQEDLTRQQIAGGPDLITQVPNMTFTKTNFSSYSIQIRGIGTQAISATTDPAVAVAFNNTPFIRNRFFEQEFYDLQRVEVLRGPQGTLYGRNATGGVVNIISQKPRFNFEAKLSGDVSNYSSSRLEGMVNIPLVEDKVALRLAGAWTKRDGYATNDITGNPIDGRDLWSTRLSLRIAPNDRINANLIWEHFEENDDRLRSGKQLCKRDVVEEVAGFPVGYFDVLPNTGFLEVWSGVQATFSQGCERSSLYSPDAFQTPNGLMLPYYLPLGAIGLPVVHDVDPNRLGDQPLDPYLSTTQSRDLRAIESMVDPDYRARTDLAELQLELDLGRGLTLASETAYSADWVWSLQDFNRFNTAPGAWVQPDTYAEDWIRPGILQEGPVGGIFCDPQLGCSDRLVAVDISTAQASQFSQELRLASDFDGPFNFSLGANFLRADSEDKYYVFINSLSMIAARSPETNFSGFDRGAMPPWVAGETDNGYCLINGYAMGDPSGVYPVTECVYIDPNPIGSLNDEGHNYFLSKNPYKLISYAAFGESYFNVTDNLKVTAGLRWTVDKKEAPRVPTWILGSRSVGYPVAETIEQEWREPTGRLTVDWKPDLAFTDETLVYASLARGYKAGGANPPGFVRSFYADPAVATANTTASATRPLTFDAEFVNAVEAGAKNTLLDGRMTLNLAAFYYDYKGYQISEIVDRSAFNRNFDAEIWGVEIEADWRPLENLRFGFKGGYEKTRIADGEQAIDLMDRTAGDPNWTLVRPFPTFASSCILPSWLFVGHRSGSGAANNPELVGLGGVGGGNPGGCELAYVQGVDPVTRRPYQANPPTGWFDIMHRGVINYTAYSTDPSAFPGWDSDTVTDRIYPGWDPTTAPNGGEGIMKPLGGNELPNAPNWTATITADYTVPLPNEWLATLHTDLHWQSESWWRVFNDHEYGRLDEYFTMNLAAIFTNEEAGWNIMAYVKNVTDVTAMTGAFLFSDDTGLTTNVFMTEPRLYGLRVTKQWTGGPLLGNFGASHEGPYPFTVELGGQIARHDAPNAVATPSFGDAFAPQLNTFAAAQEQDLDWGDGREVRLTYRPDGPWSASVGLRYARTNGTAHPYVEQETEPVCAFRPPLEAYCTQFANDLTNGPLTRLTATDWSDALVNDQEKYTIADLAVGRDFDVPGLAASRITFGLRHVTFESNSFARFRGVPDWDLSEASLLPYPSGTPATHTEYSFTALAAREFKGLGPVVSWEASIPLVAVADFGSVRLDWSMSGGVLFGDRTAAVSASETANAYETGPWVLGGRGEAEREPFPVQTAAPLNLSRSQSQTVPTLGASLGLSYDADRFKVGVGYRWERYLDAIDGGYGEAKDADRTIDGPYFKVSVGFGG